jgi:nucleoid DNA-binding protein
MTKAELIAKVASRKDLPRTLTKRAYGKIIDAVFTEVGDYFLRSRTSTARLAYPGFGTFTKRRRSSRVVRNPQTGAPIQIPAQFTVVFTPGQELKNLLNRVTTRNAKSAA